MAFRSRTGGGASRRYPSHAFSAVNYYKKESFSLNATPELLAEIAANNDIIITAIGD